MGGRRRRAPPRRSRDEPGGAIALAHDAPRTPVRGRVVSARRQLGAAVLVGIIAGVPATLLAGARFAPLIAWDAAMTFYMVWVGAEIWHLDAVRTERFAVRADPTRATTDLILLGAAMVSLVAVGIVLASAAEAKGTTQLVRVGLGLTSIVVSWGVVHCVYTLRYARLYYTGEDGGVDFKGDEHPDYRDFAYLAFGVGMTFQVADTDVTSPVIRRAVLGHALLSFVFATGILATAINLVASLSSGG